MNIISVKAQRPSLKFLVQCLVQGCFHPKNSVAFKKILNKYKTSKDVYIHIFSFSKNVYIHILNHCSFQWVKYEKKKKETSIQLSAVKEGIHFGGVTCIYNFIRFYKNKDYGLSGGKQWQDFSINFKTLVAYFIVLR